VVGRARRLRTVSAQTLKSIGLTAKLESTAALNIFSLDLRLVAGLPSLQPWRAVVSIYKIFSRCMQHKEACCEAGRLGRGVATNAPKTKGNSRILCSSNANADRPHRLSANRAVVSEGG